MAGNNPKRMPVSSEMPKVKARTTTSGQEALLPCCSAIPGDHLEFRFAELMKEDIDPALCLLKSQLWSYAGKDDEPVVGGTVDAFVFFGFGVHLGETSCHGEWRVEIA